jgi:hypothetical protein
MQRQRARVFGKRASRVAAASEQAAPAHESDSARQSCAHFSFAVKEINPRPSSASSRRREEKFVAATGICFDDFSTAADIRVLER